MKFVLLPSASQVTVEDVGKIDQYPNRNKTKQNQSQTGVFYF